MTDDTRAVAKLPHLEVEVRHRRVAEEGAEYLSVSLRAAPDLDAALGWLDPMRTMRAWAVLNPWLAPWVALGWPMLPRRDGTPAPPEPGRDED